MIIIFLTIIVFTLVSAFLYRNFYQTITQTRQITVYREGVALYVVNMEKFNLIMDRLTKKILPKEQNNIISPFR